MVECSETKKSYEPIVMVNHLHIVPVSVLSGVSKEVDQRTEQRTNKRQKPTLVQSTTARKEYGIQEWNTRKEYRQDRTSSYHSSGDVYYPGSPI